MKTAKEMFEELGYKYVSTYAHNEERINYVKEVDGVATVLINFDLEWKCVAILFNEKQYKEAEKTVDKKTQNAINKQVEELGWNKKNKCKDAS